MNRRDFLRALPAFAALPAFISAESSVLPLAHPASIPDGILIDSGNWLDNHARIQGVTSRRIGESDDSLRRRILDGIARRNI